jgi:hypothetical protein
LGVGHPPARADGGTLSHGELRVLSDLGFPAMPPSRAQQELETVIESLWADLPRELLTKVLEAAWRSATQAGGLGFSQASATVRLVCAQWQAVHDAMVKRLVLRRETTDEAMGMLVRRFPAVESLEMKWAPGGHALTDEGVRAVNSCTALTSLNLRWCGKVTDEALQAVSSLRALTFLDLSYCRSVSDEGLQTLSSLTKLTTLYVYGCYHVTAAGKQALRTAIPNLTIRDY